MYIDVLWFTYNSIYTIIYGIKSAVAGPDEV